MTVIDCLIINTQVVRNCLAGVTAEETIQFLIVRSRDLANVFRDLDLRLDSTVLLLDRNQLINAAENRLTLGSDQAFTNAEQIDLRTLTEDILNDMLVQRIGNADLAIGPTSFIQHLAGLTAEVSHITGVQTNAALGDTQRLQNLIENTDRIGNTGFQRVIGIDQQRAVVGIQLRIGLKCFILRIMHLNPGMCHGTTGLDAEKLIGNGAGGAVTAADIGSTGTQDSCVSTLRAAGTEFQNGSALSGTDNAVGLGCDQALMVNGQKQEGFDQLRLDRRRTDSHDGLSGEDGRAFRNGPDITGELKIAQVGQEFLTEELSTTQIFNILGIEMQFLNVVDDLFQTGSNGKTAAIGTLTIEHIEISNAFLVTFLKITVGHGQLIEVAEHGQIDLVVNFHGEHPLSV